MREILFRGKSYTDNKWHYGYYMLRPATPFGEERHEITDGAGLGWNCPAETIGQYTGLTDKNETKIFECDIVAVNNEVNPRCAIYTFIVSFGKCGGIRQNHSDVGYQGFYFDSYDDETNRCASCGLRDDLIYWLDNYSSEVIGNIHDTKKSAPAATGADSGKDFSQKEH